MRHRNRARAAPGSLSDRRPHGRKGFCASVPDRTCPLAIGVQTGGGDQAFLDGDTHEIVIVKGSLPAIDLGTLESYLKTKYAL